MACSEDEAFLEAYHDVGAYLKACFEDEAFLETYYDAEAYSDAEDEAFLKACAFLVVDKEMVEVAVEGKEMVWVAVEHKEMIEAVVDKA